LKEVPSEKDLGIITDRHLSFEEHINTAAKKGNQVVGIIKRSFNYLNKTTLVMLIKAMIRPRLEYGHSIWNPTLKKHKIALERIQRRATKLLPSTKNLTYSERLKVLRLPSLEYRRRRGDMIETWKILHGKYDGLFPWFILDKDSIVRGHSLKLKKIGKNTPQKRKVFSFRIINDWNSLPDSVVTAVNINTFKSNLDKFWKTEWYKFTEYGVQT
jgi:hypothetical protein